MWTYGKRLLAHLKSKKSRAIVSNCLKTNHMSSKVIYVLRKLDLFEKSKRSRKSLSQFKSMKSFQCSLKLSLALRNYKDVSKLKYKQLIYAIVTSSCLVRMKQTSVDSSSSKSNLIHSLSFGNMPKPTTMESKSG